MAAIRKKALSIVVAQHAMLRGRVGDRVFHRAYHSSNCFFGADPFVKAMRLTQLRSFYAVARAGGFTGAARLLHVSQPTVTTQVRFLEEAYGVELFHRRGRSVKITAFGEQLLEIARQIFGLESDAIELLNDSGKLRSGHVRVGAVGPYHVTEMLARFNQRYPAVGVSVRVGNSEEVLRALWEYQTDVAVLAQFSDDPGIHSMPYSRHPVVLFVHRSHRLGRRKSVDLKELTGERIIMREVGSTTRKALEEALHTAGVKPRIAMEIGSREAIREAVAKGLGVGSVSDVEYVEHPDLRMLRIADAEVYTYAHVLCLQERRGSRVVKAFLDVVEEISGLAGRAGIDGAPARARQRALRPPVRRGANRAR
jgi:LysR family transcriptional regulator, low CO2-responsive transcriptional regulator